MNLQRDDIMNRMKSMIKIYSNSQTSKTKQQLLHEICSKSCTNQVSELVHCVTLSGTNWCAPCISFLIDAPESSWKRASYVNCFC